MFDFLPLMWQNDKCNRDGCGVPKTPTTRSTPLWGVSDIRGKPANKLDWLVAVLGLPVSDTYLKRFFMEFYNEKSSFDFNHLYNSFECICL